MNPFTNKKASIFREKSRLQKTYADIIVKRITICFILIGKQLEKYEKTGKTEKQSGLRDSESTTENGTDNSSERRKNLTRKTPESQT
ncbi:MAG: hypothetical protein J6M38_09250 [Lentisphaeria bacterium]|nr:hypothetical protein [Lentisphaeria bacterium]